MFGQGYKKKNLTIWDDRIRLSAVLERPSKEPCPLMIVLHGFTSNKKKLHALATCEAMREAGFATLRFDLYGHGSSGGRFRDHTLYKWISNTLAVLNWARKLDFVTEIWISGHSQGGLTAAVVAAMAPDLIRGMVLRAPAFYIPQQVREGNLFGARFDPDRIPEYVEPARGVVVGADYLRTAMTLHAEEAIDRYPGPVLLVQGELDDDVLPQYSEQAAQRYRNCTLAVIPGEDHHFGKCRDRMQAVIRDWLQSVR